LFHCQGISRDTQHDDRMILKLSSQFILSPKNQLSTLSEIKSIVSTHFSHARPTHNPHNTCTPLYRSLYSQIGCITVIGHIHSPSYLCSSLSRSMHIPNIISVHSRDKNLAFVIVNKQSANHFYPFLTPPTNRIGKIYRYAMSHH